jgi:hypothetical protein
MPGQKPHVHEPGGVNFHVTLSFSIELGVLCGNDNALNVRDAWVTQYAISLPTSTLSVPFCVVHAKTDKPNTSLILLFSFILKICFSERKGSRLKSTCQVF